MMDEQEAVEWESVELVEEDGGGWCPVCGEPIERGQEVTFRAGVRCHLGDGLVDRGDERSGSAA